MGYIFCMRGCRDLHLFLYTFIHIYMYIYVYIYKYIYIYITKNLPDLLKGFENRIELLPPMEQTIESIKNFRSPETIQNLEHNYKTNGTNY